MSDTLRPLEAIPSQIWIKSVSEIISSQVMPENIRSRVVRKIAEIELISEFLYGIVEDADPRRPVVIAFDEITAVPDELKRPFFTRLRGIFNDKTNPAAPAEARALQFIFCGSFDPDRVIDDETSPFNVAQTIETADCDFTVDQIAELAARVGVGVDAVAIQRATGGQPYLTSLMLASLLEGHSVEAAVMAMLRRNGHLAALGRLLREGGSRCHRVWLGEFVMDKMFPM